MAQNISTDPQAVAPRRRITLWFHTTEAVFIRSPYSLRIGLFSRYTMLPIFKKTAMGSFVFLLVYLPTIYKDIIPAAFMGLFYLMMAEGGDYIVSNRLYLSRIALETTFFTTQKK